nr:sigma factor [Naasia aerilata]
MKRFGSLDTAEDAAAEAFAVAAERWPADGIPPNAGAWLTTTATHKAIYRIRRESSRDAKQRRRSSCTAQTRNPSVRSTTTGCGSSSPAATRRWRWRPASR